MCCSEAWLLTRCVMSCLGCSAFLFLSTLYEGHSIGKLQNMIILLVFQILKIRNIRFIGNLIPSSSCEFYDDDVTVTSFLDIKYGDIVTEILPSQHVIIVLLFAKKINANQIHSEMRPVYGNKCFRSEQFTFGVKENARWAEICIIYPGAISRSSVAWTAASIILYVWHSEVCWQIGQNSSSKLSWKIIH